MFPSCKDFLIQRTEELFMADHKVKLYNLPTKLHRPLASILNCQKFDTLQMMIDFYYKYMYIQN